VALIQESLLVATRTGAAKPADFSKVIVDTTVQPKAVAFPTDAKLMHRARERLVKLAKKTGVSLRQSYARVGKHALIAHQRYAHAKQFNRANRVLRTYLGRSFATSCARSRARLSWRAPSPIRSCSPAGCASSASISAGKRSIRCTRPRSNASARARPIVLMSSASRSRSPQRSIAPGAASFIATPRRCRATLTMATRSPS